MEFDTNSFVASSLLEMYAKYGNIGSARQVFDGISHRNLFHGTQCAHYEMHGRGDLVLRLFHQMQQEGIKPNHITFAAVLSACSHAEHAALSSRAGNILIYD